MSEVKVSPIHHPDLQVLTRGITRLEQHIKSACCGFLLSITPDDLECREGKGKIKQEIQDARLVEYARFLEQRYIELTQENDRIIGELEATKQELRMVRIYEKDERKGIRTAHRTAEKAWRDVEHNKQHAQYEINRKNHERTLAEANILEETLFERGQIGDRIKNLQDKLVSSRKNIELFDAESKKKIFAQKLGEFSVLENLDTATVKEKLPSSSFFVKNVRNAVAAIIMLGGAAGLYIANRTDGNVSSEKSFSQNSRVKQETSGIALHIQKRNSISVEQSIRQLEQHGNLARFKGEIEQEFHKNFREIMGRDDRGTISIGMRQGDYLTYESDIGNGLLLDFGVTHTGIGQALAAYLVKTIQAKNIGIVLCQIIQTNGLRTMAQNSHFSSSIPLPTSANIQRQNETPNLQRDVLSCLTEISNNMSKNGYPMNASQTEVLTHQQTGKHFLKLVYTVADQQHTVEYIFD